MLGQSGRGKQEFSWGEKCSSKGATAICGRAKRGEGDTHSASPECVGLQPPIANYVSSLDTWRILSSIPPPVERARSGGQSDGKLVMRGCKCSLLTTGRLSACYEPGRVRGGYHELDKTAEATQH
jgi:hypothetical protein